MNTDIKYSYLSLLILCLITLTLVQPSFGQNSPQDYLNAHNSARTKLGLAPMTWDPIVATYAQIYANLRAVDCNLVHSDTDYGENIAKGYGTTFTGVTAVGLWVDEKPYYDYNSNTCIGGVDCLHYTQVMWHDSTTLGCARVQCKNSNWYFVTCNYNPPGNYEDEHPY